MYRRYKGIQKPKSKRNSRYILAKRGGIRMS